MSARTESIFEEYAAQQGWNDASKIAILLEYISNQQSDDAFADFLAEQASFENSLSILG